MMMKNLSLIVALATVLGVQSFSSSPLATSRASLTQVYGYVPQGFTAESYKKFKETEKKKLDKKNLGGVGPRGFKSRSFQSFQEALERGEASHMMPMEFAAEKLKKGLIKKEDIPYMQRGGSWDNSDVKGAKKVKWLGSDKDYAGGGFKKEQSVSIFGVGKGLDWTGGRAREGPGENMPGGKFAKNYKAPNVNTMKGIKAPKVVKAKVVKGKAAPKVEEKKKFFGML
jgi:hypothetical protein